MKTSFQKDISNLIKQLVKFQTFLARKNGGEEWESEEVEEVQNTINLLNNYL